MSQLLVLSADDPDSDVCLFVDSPGGSVLAGCAFYDVMHFVPNDVSTVAALVIARKIGVGVVAAGSGRVGDHLPVFR